MISHSKDIKVTVFHPHFLVDITERSFLDYVLRRFGVFDLLLTFNIYFSVYLFLVCVIKVIINIIIITIMIKTVKTTHW